MDWPETLPLPTVNFSGRVGSDLIRTEMDSGRTRQRARFGNSSQTFRVEWIFTAVEFEIFADFFASDLVNGSLWFNLALPETDTLEPVSVRFTGEFSKAYVGHMHYRVSADIERATVQTVEVETPDLMPKWYRPEIVVTDSYTMTSADAGKLFRCQPESSGQVLLLQDDAEDLSEMPFGVQLETTGSVLVSNIPINSPPLPKTVTMSTFQDVATSGDASTVDPDGDAITYSEGSTAPAHGSIVVDSVTGEVDYTPDSGYIGADNFTVAADDGNGNITQVLCIVSVESPSLTWEQFAEDNFTVIGIHRADNVTLDVNGYVAAMPDLSGNGNTLTDSQGTTLHCPVVSGWLQPAYSSTDANNQRAFMGKYASTYQEAICIAICRFRSGGVKRNDTNWQERIVGSSQWTSGGGTYYGLVGCPTTVSGNGTLRTINTSSVFNSSHRPSTDANQQPAVDEVFALEIEHVNGNPSAQTENFQRVGINYNDIHHQTVAGYGYALNGFVTAQFNTSFNIQNRTSGAEIAAIITIDTSGESGSAWRANLSKLKQMMLAEFA